MVLECFGYFSEYREVTGTPRGKYWATMGHRGERGKPTRGSVPPMGYPNWTRGMGVPPFPLPLSLSFPLSTSKRRMGVTWTRSPSRFPPWRAP